MRRLVRLRGVRMQLQNVGSLAFGVVPSTRLTAGPSERPLYEVDSILVSSFTKLIECEYS